MVFALKWQNINSPGQRPGEKVNPSNRPRAQAEQSFELFSDGTKIKLQKRSYKPESR